MAWSCSAAAFYPWETLRTSTMVITNALPGRFHGKRSFPCGLGHSISEQFFVAGDHRVRWSVLYHPPGMNQHGSVAQLADISMECETRRIVFPLLRKSSIRSKHFP